MGNVLAVVVPLALILSLSCSGTEESVPCDSDPLQCRNSEESFQTDESCTNTSSLRIGVGEGERALTLFEPGQAPRFYRGTQLGQHVFVAFRLYGADDDYEGIEADITLRNANTTQTRHLIIAQGFVADAMGSLDVTGIVIIAVGAPPGSQGQLSISVQDRCGRTASVEHDFLYE